MARNEKDHEKRGYLFCIELGAGSQPIGSRRSAKLWRARSRRYRSQMLQVNMRLKALAEIFQTHIYLQNLRTRSFFPFSNKILLPTSSYFQQIASIQPKTSLSKLYVNSQSHVVLLTSIQVCKFSTTSCLVSEFAYIIIYY